MRFGQVSNKVIAVPIAATVLLGGLAVDGRLSRIDGVILLAAYAAAVLYLIWLARRGESVEASGQVGKELGKPEGPGTAKSAAVVVMSLLFIIAGSELLVTGVRDVVNRFGVFETAIGMTVVALAISLEEVARTVPAARAGRADVGLRQRRRLHPGLLPVQRRRHRPGQSPRGRDLDAAVLPARGCRGGRARLRVPAGPAAAALGRCPARRRLPRLRRRRLPALRRPTRRHVSTDTAVVDVHPALPSCRGAAASRGGHQEQKYEERTGRGE